MKGLQTICKEFAIAPEGLLAPVQLLSSLELANELPEEEMISQIRPIMAGAAHHPAGNFGRQRLSAIRRTQTMKLTSFFGILIGLLTTSVANRELTAQAPVTAVN